MSVECESDVSILRLLLSEHNSTPTDLPIFIDHYFWKLCKKKRKIIECFLEIGIACFLLIIPCSKRKMPSAVSNLHNMDLQSVRVSIFCHALPMVENFFELSSKHIVLSYSSLSSVKVCHIILVSWKEKQEKKNSFFHIQWLGLRWTDPIWIDRQCAKAGVAPCLSIICFDLRQSCKKEKKNFQNF